jgi:hypothetical protein
VVCVRPSLTSPCLSRACWLYGIAFTARQEVSVPVAVAPAPLPGAAVPAHPWSLAHTRMAQSSRAGSFMASFRDLRDGFAAQVCPRHDAAAVLACPPPPLVASRLAFLIVVVAERRCGRLAAPSTVHSGGRCNRGGVHLMRWLSCGNALVLTPRRRCHAFILTTVCCGVCGGTAGYVRCPCWVLPLWQAVAPRHASPEQPRFASLPALRACCRRRTLRTAPRASRTR